MGVSQQVNATVAVLATLGIGTAAYFILKGGKPAMQKLKFAPMDESTVDTVLATLEEEGHIQHMVYGFDDSLEVHWLPDSRKQKDVPTQRFGMYVLENAPMVA